MQNLIIFENLANTFNYFCYNLWFMQTNNENVSRFNSYFVLYWIRYILITILLPYVYQMGLFYLSEKMLNTSRICSEMLCWIWESKFENCQWGILPILQWQVRNQQECRLWYVQTCTLISGSCRLIFWRSHFEKSEDFKVLLSSMGSNELPRVFLSSCD